MDAIKNKKRVRVFSTPVCPYCVTLKEYLKSYSVEFEDIDVSQNKAALDEMIEKSDQMGVPVIEIGEKIVIGFDKSVINELLDIKE
ncbi:MAG: NrdH-redoxin [Candidatus Nealsonbacteria bacterium RIFCSPLOWO2_12_FULL_39_31]|uniref:NrdH-redoxin n=3 Tax=Candidatus Nealsoniibacteriota TaxID=1817911 RepID=A0A1G2EH45_9BACT|nr:MAG: Glutaredoxin-like protein, YruB-family [Parcubacteria group bacterium GW2011_GWA2_38_27]KKQ97818.1 MAG: Glutaredoxin-like protein, YruB-family [Parcubacteria group bacterium GW2011_GWC2_39_11]OGZ19297.1 MAG: NrdH-redoxin [Candidatus Nealsonbacteria bacterium RIFCSPHIGHO2_01_FULL_38_55]OGZ21369.1 MAG: NrdH-redoxin [Candidatus Nealsonbacteria bacterium RIFCSPHIGHO2_02_38_10]OGZ21809.1 MAG: NrdH-redoxin [Candidatus Nealsonbacteria bacterium RIFCSPHIGHO2_02_FULL_38_75]OGZ22494.1 MAG: NrdH-